MKYLRATFKNYIGFYNGMNLDVVDIDLSKSTNKIILLVGQNGSGKSTLLSHLNPFPDGSTSFIPDRSAEKDLVLFNDGNIYTIQIYSPADAKGRKTTKAYIQKDGVELNENGNVSSYKDIIFSEFELDSNYLSLASLSSNNKGLGDKTPAERKKFIANIMENLEVYNDMYKTLNKKSLVYKSQLNNLHTKIQNIGAKEALEQRLTDLRSRESELNSNILGANNEIVTIRAKNSIDEDEANEIKLATEKVSSLNTQKSLIEAQLDSFYNRTKIKKESISDKYKTDKDLHDSYTNKVDSISTIWRDKSKRLSDINDSIMSIEAQLSSTDYKSDIMERYKNSNDKIDSLLDELKKIDIKPDTGLIYSINGLIKFCERFISILDNFNDNITTDDIKYLVTKYNNEHIESLGRESDEIKLDIERANASLAENKGRLEIISTLSNRPSNCKIDNCSFISEALNLKKSEKDIKSQIKTSERKISSLSARQQEIDKECLYVNSLSAKNTYLHTLRSLISEYEADLSVFYPNLFNRFDELLINMYSFNEIRDCSRLTDGSNLLTILEKEMQDNKVLKVEYDGYSEKIKLLNSSKSMLEKLKKEETTLVDEVKDLKAQLDEYNKTLSDINSIIDTECQYSLKYSEYLNILGEINIAQSKIDEFNKKSSKALESMEKISELQNTINKLSAVLEPIMKDISTISGQLTLLDSYYQEYNQCKESYDLIEILKKYCSPTGGGIQTLFMNLYMGKTKQVANEVLAMLFNGAYQLMDFVINENEFRIPFIGEGLPVDDISSGSSSQVSMMSMILNLVLLHQGSTKFNIAQLDECDAALDQHNRSQFVNVLFHTMNILNIEQLFIISHSIEIDNTFADIIKLKSEESYESGIQSGNIIWDYSKECNSTLY